MKHLFLKKIKAILTICFVLCLCVPDGTSVMAATASTLKVTGYGTPKTLIQGKAFIVKGTVTSNYKITKVTAYIATSGGTVKYTKTVNPNTTSYSLSGVDAAMRFDLLTPGNYVFRVDAGDTSGVFKNILSQNFKVVSKLAASGYNSLNQLTEGQAFIVKGTVTSNYMITKVTADIVNSEGSVIYTKTVNPNVKSYSLSGVDAAMRFDLLSVGSYVFRVDAADASGTAKTVVKQNFTVAAKNAPVLEGTGNVAEWLADCKNAFQYYANNGFSYGIASPNYIGTQTTNKKTNCAAYVSWCLYKNGFVNAVGDTNQFAQGVAAYVRTLGWTMNTDVNNIKTGDIVYYDQKVVTEASRQAAIQWVRTHSANQGSSGMHIDICYNAAKKQFLSAGDDGYITTGKIATYGNYLSQHFVCSFRYPG